MSRAATALAYEPTTETARGSRRAEATSLRILGAESAFTGAFAPARAGSMVAPGPRALHLELVEEARPLPYVSHSLRARRRALPPGAARWLVAPALLAAAGLSLLLVHGEVRGSGAMLSGYSNVEHGAVTALVDAAQVPVIDLSTEAQPAASAPAPGIAHSAANGEYTLLGNPSVSVKQIETVLQQYGSPAVGKGQALYDLGVKYGIDPLYALAFFVHESGCGTKGVARFTKSIGNIRWTEGYDSYSGYRSYNSWESGIDDWYKLIKDLYIDGWGLKTVDAIIPVYAPSGDNNVPPVYIAAVKSLVDSWRGK